MRRLAPALFIAVTLGAACSREPDVGLRLSLPDDVRSKARWLEVGAFKDATCDGLDPMLDNGVPNSYTARTAFRIDEAGPTFGRIPNGKYAFGATARDKDCAVLAAGCKEVDLDDDDEVVIDLQPIQKPVGKCGPGASCQAARCAPANDNLDPSVGAECSLELLGAGPLPVPTLREGTLISAPTIAATPNGFLIVYREVSGGGSEGLISIVPVDASGGALPPLRQKLTTCAASDDADGLGLVLNGTDALVTLAKPACGETNALQVARIKVPTDVARDKVEISELLSTAYTTPVTLGAGRPAAPRSGGGFLVYTQDDLGKIVIFDPTKGVVPAFEGNFGGPGVKEAWVAATPQVLALLASASEAPPTSDGGAPAPGTAEPELRLLMVPPATPTNTISSPATPRAPVAFPGTVGSIAAKDGRVIVASDGDSVDSVSYRAFDIGSDKPKATGGFSVEGDPQVTALDVQIQGDRAYFASVKKGGVSLHVFDGATTTLRPIRNVAFAREPRISGITIVRDGRVALAATDTRVGVVWTTAKQLGSNDSSGGYAVFACTR
jgi:hypothetical protein